ncbi:MAG TPA: alpha/beta fold hydrolase, partial [Chitinophagales bacterium]
MAGEKNVDTLDDYFDYVADTFGYPRYQRKFESDTVKSDNEKLHVDVLTADKNAPTIVVMPGTAIYALCHAELMYKLYEAGYNVVGFDPRGHGQSTGERGDYSAEELMTDAENVISYAIKRFTKKVTLFGSSQGGIIALYLAAKDERLDSVICHTFADLSDNSAIRLTRHPRLFKYLKSVLAPAGKLVPMAHVPVNSY